MAENSISLSHSEERLSWISKELSGLGIYDYRFCVENDCYVCDRSGNFFSICKRQTSKTGNFIQLYEIKKLLGSTDRYGYTTYRITVDGVKKHLKGHRMMMNAWIGVRPDMVVNHIDGNKKNNALSNLEWCTVAENNAHAIRTGLFDPYARKKFDYAIPASEWMSIYILNKHLGYSYSKLGRMYGCVHDTIKSIVKRIDSIMPEVVKNGT